MPMSPTDIKYNTKYLSDCLTNEFAKLDGIIGNPYFSKSKESRKVNFALIFQKIEPVRILVKNNLTKRELYKNP